LKRLGARGTVDVGASGLQVVVGPMADGIAGDIRAWLAGGGARGEGEDVDALLDALGGSRNVEAMQAATPASRHAARRQGDRPRAARVGCAARRRFRGPYARCIFFTRAALLAAAIAALRR
jgi:PTS system N-acetylglucosamine-specific IIC component